MAALGGSLSRILAIVRKELLVLGGSRVSRMMLIVPPLIQICVFGFAATLEVRNIHMGILNHDSGKYSRELVSRIAGSPSFTSIRHLASEDELRTALDRQQILLALVFDQEFSRNVERGSPASVQALLDGRRSNSAQLAAAYLGEIVSGLDASVSGASAGGLDLAVRFWFNPNLEFQWFFLPNLIGLIGMMLGLVVTGLSVAREREMGTFSQLLVSPASAAEIAIGKLVPGCLVGMFEGCIFWLIARFGFGVPFNGSLWLFALTLFVFTLAASALGLMISSLCQTQQQAFLGAFTVGVPCILISGAVTPLINMPDFLQRLSQINPLRHFTVINLGLFLKDITPGAAFMNLGKIAVLTSCFIAIAIWMFRRRS